jgi:hypothetical protein
MTLSCFIWLSARPLPGLPDYAAIPPLQRRVVMNCLGCTAKLAMTFMAQSALRHAIAVEVARTGAAATPIPSARTAQRQPPPAQPPSSQAALRTDHENFSQQEDTGPAFISIYGPKITKCPSPVRAGVPDQRRMSQLSQKTWPVTLVLRFRKVR